MPKNAKVPKLCYVIVPGAPKGKRIGIVHRGERGYHLADLDRAYSAGRFMDGDEVKAFVDMMNQGFGVDLAEAEAMMRAALFGSHVPFAKP